MDDKKKMMIVGALLVVMLGVGAFQFIAGSSSPAPATAKAEPKEGEGKDSETPIENPATGEDGTLTQGDPNAVGPDGKVPVKPGEEPDPALTVKMNSRDPFDGRAWSGDVIVKGNVYGAPAAPTQAPTPSVPSIPRPRPVRRPNREIQIPPFDPSDMGPGSLQALPGPGEGRVALGNPAPGAPSTMPSIEDVPYSVSGTIRGRRQAAVFKDANGNQRLVKAGDKLDGDTEVVSVSNGKVVVKHRGKTKALKVDRAGGQKEEKTAGLPNPTQENGGNGGESGAKGGSNL